jgi:hypothetical protein
MVRAGQGRAGQGALGWAWLGSAGPGLGWAPRSLLQRSASPDPAGALPADEIPGLVGDQQGRPCLVVLPSDRPASRREALEVEALLAQLLQEPAGAAARWAGAAPRRRGWPQTVGMAHMRPCNATVAAANASAPRHSCCCRACQWRAAALTAHSADALATIATSLAARGGYSHTWQFRSAPSPQQLLPLPGEAGYGGLGSGAGLAALSGLLQAKGRPSTAMQAHYESSRGAAAAGSGRAPSPPRQRPGSPGLLGAWRCPHRICCAAAAGGQ